MTQHEQQRTGSVQAEANRLAHDAEAKGRELKDEASGLADQAKGAARDVAQEARSTGASIKQEAMGVVGAVRQGLAAKAEQQKGQVADQIGALADRVHASADEMRDHQAWLADLIDRGARELDGFADAVKQRDLTSIVGAAESFARRQPALFMGAAVLAGFALTRFARASMEQQGGYSVGNGYRTGGQTGTGYRPAGGYQGGGQGGHTGYQPSTTVGKAATTEFQRHVQGAATASAGGTAPQTDPTGGSAH